MATLYDILEQHKKSKADKRVFGLVLQGGGMRAAYAAGAVVPLIQYEFTNAFEHVVGSSAGAINGAYFIDKHLETKDAYMYDLSNKNFVNLLRSEKKIDIDYAVDTVLKQKYPLNISNLNRAHAKLHTVLTDAKTGKLVVISDHKKFAEIYEELRATAAIPILYDKSVIVGGTYYVDGGVADLLPVDVAIKLGCTDIVVIMTQQIKNYRFDTRHTRLVRHLIQRYAKNQTEAVRKKLPTDERVLLMNLRSLRRPYKKIRIYTLEPSDEEILISKATIDKPKVETLVRLGIADMDTFLNREIIER